MREMRKLSGVYTALITPFFKNKVDFDSLNRILYYQISQGITQFVVNGTTGESPTLEDGEVEAIFKFVRSFLKAKNLLRYDEQILVGAGGNATHKLVRNIQFMRKKGVSHFLSVVPYYNKPNQTGLWEHFSYLANEFKNSYFVLYNVPGRTVARLEIATIQKLSKLSNIIGIKEASGDLVFDKKLIQSVNQNFSVLSGDDLTYEDFLRIGGSGIVSVGSHILGKAFLEGKIKSYLPLIKLLYEDSNPQPVKMALHIMGLIRSPECRLPLVKISQELTKKLQKALKKTLSKDTVTEGFFN